MVFSSTVFLFFFLPWVLTLTLIVPRRLRNPILLVSSLFFYAWGEAFFVLLMIASIGINYVLGLLIATWRSTPKVRIVLAVAVVVNIGLLGTFKYANFFVDNLNALLGLWDLPPLMLDPVHLPIGISFFTFQALSSGSPSSRSRRSPTSSTWRAARKRRRETRSTSPSTSRSFPS